MLYWRFAWRELKQRPSRPILTLLSIVIGVAAVVAVSISTKMASRAFDEIFQTVAGKASLKVKADIGTSFKQDIVAKLRAIPGVKAAVPLMERPTKLNRIRGGAKLYQLTSLGVDPAVDREVHEYEITAGKSLAEASGILLDESFAKRNGFNVGDSVELLSRKRGFVEAPVVGIFASKGTAATNEGATMYLPLVAAQVYFGNLGEIDSALIVTEEDADIETVKQAIAAHLPEGVRVAPPAARSSLAEETSRSAEQGMRLARGFALLVAVFIITNTFLINVTQRRRQIGIMRAIGATRAQIAGMVFREALMMGVVGTIIGSLLGIVGAHYLSEAMGTLYQVSLPAVQLTLYPFLVGGACGLGISLVAAAIPARKAINLSPLEAMRDVLPEEIEGPQWWLTGLGVAIVDCCAGVMVATKLGAVPATYTVWASIVMLVGIVLLLPIALNSLSAAVRFALRYYLPVEGKLARLQLLRHRSRTTLTVGVLFIAAATGIGLANSVMDTVEDVRGWYRKTFVADFFVRASSPSMATGLSADLPENVGPELKQVPGIVSMDATRLGSITIGDQQANLIARDHTLNEAPNLDVITGNLATLRESFRKGEVAIGSVLAERMKLKLGDKLKLETDKGEKTFPVAAIVNDYQSGGLTLHMERAVAKRELGYEGVSGYVIKVDHALLPEARKKIEAICAENGIELKSFSDIQQKIDRMMSGVVAALWAMVVLGLLVSAVGVTNTLTINVLEQTRELGLLRIVAMTQAQVRRTIMTQAVIMAVLALVPGIIAGVTVAYLINVLMMPELGHPVQFNIQPTLLVGGLVVGMAVVAIAAWFPANRASRLDLLEALRTL